MRMRYQIGTTLLAFLAFAAGEPRLSAAQTAWQPSPGHAQVRIWPGSNMGAAVVVFPGGGYIVLAIDLEGTEVCDWLTSKGITCVK